MNSSFSIVNTFHSAYFHGSMPSVFVSAARTFSDGAWIPLSVLFKWFSPIKEALVHPALSRCQGLVLTGINDSGWLAHRFTPE